MKKILFSALMIVLLAGSLTAGTIAFFADSERSQTNTYAMGTIEISVNEEMHWTGNFVWDDIKPGREQEFELVITNEGDNPLRLWKIIKCLVPAENGIIEPEQAWYDQENGGNPKNDIESVLLYELTIDDEVIFDRQAGIVMADVADSYLGLVKLDKSVDPTYIGPETNGTGILNPGGTVVVRENFIMPEEVGNWAQSDQLTFVVELEARQITDAPEPQRQLAIYDNKEVPGSWSPIIDDRLAIVKYKYQGPEFEYQIKAVGMDQNTKYCMIYARDPWAAPKSLIGKGESDMNGLLNFSGSIEIGNMPSEDDDNYPTGAKIWFIPCDIYNGTSFPWLPENDWLYDGWPGFINYREGEALSEELNCQDYSVVDGTEPPVNSVCTDSDQDGYFVEAAGCEDEPGFLGHSDCSDNNPDSWRVALYYYDGDGDGYYGDGPNRREDGQMAVCCGEGVPAGYSETTLGLDCDDNDAEVNPGETEICADGVDNDCDSFTDQDDPDCADKSVALSDLESTSQFGPYYDYSQAEAYLLYDDGPGLSGRIVGRNLKPYATYQLKFEGRPTCASQYEATGNNAINQAVGLNGRWWNVAAGGNLNGDPAVNDAFYYDRSVSYDDSGDLGDNDQCIQGYMVWDFVTADENGDFSKDVALNNSYHVLFCSGGTCGLGNNNYLVESGDADYHDYPTCEAEDVNGQLERASCGTASLPNGNYDLNFVLVEESFHETAFGTWSTVMGADISFVIN